MKKQCGLKQNSALKKELLILFSQYAFSLVPNLLFFFCRGKFTWYQTILNRIKNYVILFIYITYKYKYFQISGSIGLLLLEEYWIRQCNYQHVLSAYKLWITLSRTFCGMTRQQTHYIHFLILQESFFLKRKAWHKFTSVYANYEMCVCTHIHCVLQETVLVYVYSLGLIIKVPCSMHTHICICVCVCVC